MKLTLKFSFLLNFLFSTNAYPPIEDLNFAPKLKLNDGNEIPTLGLGTWQMVYDRTKLKLFPFLRLFDSSSKIVTQSVINAIEVGYRHIDTAYVYNNEKAIGKAFKQVIYSKQVKREDLFITTKIWNNFHSRARVIENLNISLKDLGLDYVDLALMHFPLGFEEGDNVYPLFLNGSIIPNTWKKEDFIEVWKGLEDAKKSGLAKSIGVANFNDYQLERLLYSAEIPPAVNQVECNPYFNQQQLVEFCNYKKIKVIAYSPLRQADKELLNDHYLREIARKHKKTVAQVALRWNIQRGVIVIPKSTHKSFLAENIGVFDFKISDEDMKRILRLGQKEKIVTLDQAKNHPDYPFINKL